MRVAYLCADPGVPVFGCKGASIHVQEVVRALVRRGAEVVLFAARFGGAPPADLAQVQCRALPLGQGSDAAARERQAIAANGALANALGADGAFDLVYERYSLWSHAGIEWAAAHGIPGLLEVNAPLIEEQARHRGLHDRTAAEATARRVFSAAHAIVAVSTGVAAHVRKMGGGNVYVIANGVDAARFDPAPRPGGRFTVGFVGTLKPWHGLPVLVEAAGLARARGVDLDLLIVGDGPERAALAERIEAAGLTASSDLRGAVTPAAIPALIARMDVAVAPYPELPGFYFSPLKVMEYMAAGRAIVASRIGDIGDILVHEETALLTTPGDPAALADAVHRLDRDPGLRLQLGRNARAEAERKHSWANVAQRILDLAQSRECEAA